jgi:hypothetical protein
MLQVSYQSICFQVPAIAQAVRTPFFVPIDEAHELKIDSSLGSLLLSRHY